tara:strand:- start:3098 stop:3400 length:303 start_codon:yes stop_codon:yes gene_type:complete
MATIYEQIQVYCRALAGVSAGTYNENMIQAAEAETGRTNMTANEAELALLQSETGNTTSVLADMRGYWPSIVGAGFDNGEILIETGFHVLLEDGSFIKME